MKGGRREERSKTLGLCVRGGGRGKKLCSCSHTSARSQTGEEGEGGSEGRDPLQRGCAAAAITSAAADDDDAAHRGERPQLEVE